MAPNPVRTLVYIKGGNLDTGREKVAMSQGRLRGEGCIYKLRKSKDCPGPPEAGKEERTFPQTLRTRYRLECCRTERQ